MTRISVRKCRALLARGSWVVSMSLNMRVMRLVGCASMQDLKWEAIDNQTARPGEQGTCIEYGGQTRKRTLSSFRRSPNDLALSFIPPSIIWTFSPLDLSPSIAKLLPSPGRPGLHTRPAGAFLTRSDSEDRADLAAHAHRTLHGWREPSCTRERRTLPGLRKAITKHAPLFQARD